MNLNEAQRQAVSNWIAQGAKLSDIQNRLSTEFGVRLTYMEVRLLVDDLKVIPKDPEPAPAPKLAAELPPQEPEPLEPEPEPAAGGVSVSVDQLTRPGSLVSGKVTFSDGNKADWYLSQDGRLGLAPAKQGYRPPPADVQEFQLALQAELAKLGF